MLAGRISLVGRTKEKMKKEDGEEEEGRKKEINERTTPNEWEMKIETDMRNLFFRLLWGCDLDSLWQAEGASLSSIIQPSSSATDLTLGTD